MQLSQPPNTYFCGTLQFKDIIGQEAVKNQLTQSVREGRIAHAQLFVGPEGSGTLPMALAYLQYLSCHGRTDADSCGTCPSCLKYGKLAHPDLHMVFPVNTTKSVTKHPMSSKFLPEFRQAVSDNAYMGLFDWLEFIGIGNKQGNINVDEAAELLRSLSLKAYEGGYKVVCIWMAERLNGSSANKLLKIIEEPPEKTVFILIAESVEPILPTILSRTQLIKFPAPTMPEIAAGLQERTNLDEQRANRIAYLAEGNFNEALRLAGDNDEAHLYEELFIHWMRMSFKKDIISIMGWIDEVHSMGRERQKRLLSFALNVFRESLMLNYGASEIVHMDGKLLAFTKKFAPFFNEVNCMKFTEEFNLAISHIERNANPRILFLDLSVKVIQYLLAKPSLLQK